MLNLKELAVFVLLVPLVTQSEGNEKVYDTYFNGFCFWSEEISYHVHYESGCKIYFTCQRGKFLEFKRCPESTIFNTETLQCDSHGICNDPANVNPTYKAWWEKVVNVIDEAFEALSNTSTTSQIRAATLSTKMPQMKLDASTVVLPTTTLPKAILQTKTQLPHSDSLDETFTSDTDGKTDIGLKDTDLVEDTSIKPSQSIAKSSETNMASSIYFVPMQFNTQNPISTDSLYSTVLPLQEDMARKIDELISPFKVSNCPDLFDTKIVDDFINPLVQDFLKNATFMIKLNHFFDVIFKTADPLLYQILDQKLEEDMGSIKNISLKEIRDTWNRTKYMVGPLLYDMYPYLFDIFLDRVRDSGDIILNYYIRNNHAIKKNFWFLFGILLELVYKHRPFHPALPSDILITYSVLNIRKEIQNFFKIVTDALKDQDFKV